MKLAVFLLLLLSPVALSAQTFYKTPSGKKYHRADCRMVEHTSAAVSAEDIRRIGLGPCSICKPSPANTTRRLMNTPRGTGVGEGEQTQQCRGYTQAGARCKHRTSIADGYCYQHRPR